MHKIRVMNIQLFNHIVDKSCPNEFQNLLKYCWFIFPTKLLVYLGNFASIPYWNINPKIKRKLFGIMEWKRRCSSRVVQCWRRVVPKLKFYQVGNSEDLVIPPPQCLVYDYIVGVFTAVHTHTLHPIIYCIKNPHSIFHYYF